MSILDPLRDWNGSESTDDAEQLAPDETDDGDAEQLAPDDPDPRGENRDDESGFLFSWLSGGSTSTTTRTQSVDISSAPDDIESDWEDYYPFPPVRAALQIFADTVLEPGYRIKVTGPDGEEDEDMREALVLWGDNAAIHAGQTGQDLLTVLDAIVKRRRGQGTLFMEPVGTESDPDTLAAVTLHNPATFRQYSRENQSILVQPTDDVNRDHPRNENDEAAAYVQYDEALESYGDKDPIPFAEDELMKLLYDPEPWGLWGRSIFDSIGDTIDALERKWDDRDQAIHQTGHPHRIYSAETWTIEEAQTYAKKHKKGDVSAYQDEEDQGTFAGRVDFVNDEVNVTTEQGSVADISDAVMDDLEKIFSVLPISKFKIAYEEDINQFVVEPQQQKDSLLVDKEREYLESRVLQPLFDRKADELAGGEYEGEVNALIEPDRDENPLRRESFPAENLDTFGTFLKNFYASGANQDIPLGAALDKIGMNLKEMQEEFEWQPDEVMGQIDESSPEAQAQAEAMDTATSGGDAVADGGTDEEADS